MNSPTIQVTKVTTDGMVKSTSDSSLSSIGSSSSTGKLIKSLSTDRLKKDEVITAKPLSPPLSENTNHNQIPSPPNDSKTTTQTPKPTLNNNNKKPIKFTVRKVSHEPINSPNIDTENFSSKHHELDHHHRHHSKHRRSSSSNKAPTTATTTFNTGDGKEEERYIRINNQLDQTQSQFDQYHSRIVKIEKEISFLTNLLPPYNVEIDYSTRLKINKAIEKLTMKKDEIEKKKYTLGITLSRLSRELDNRDIWVRAASKR